MKALGLDIEVDILVINSLISQDIVKLGDKCGINLFSSHADSFCSKIKELEKERGKKLAEQEI